MHQEINALTNPKNIYKIPPGIRPILAIYHSACRLRHSSTRKAGSGNLMQRIAQGKELEFYYL